MILLRVGLFFIAAMSSIVSAEVEDCSVKSDLEVRVSFPVVVRGPKRSELDTRFPVVSVHPKKFVAFSSNRKILRVESDGLEAMQNKGREVLSPIARSPDNACGYWMNDIKKGKGYWWGFVHTEQFCSYQGAHFTNKFTQLAVSSDEGETWLLKGAILSAAEVPDRKKRRQYGEGGCTIVDGADGFLYAYCRRERDLQTIVSRAPSERPFPGMWKKYYESEWSQSGVGGDAESLGHLGTGAAYWVSQGWVLLFGNDGRLGGVKLSISCDKVHFLSLKEPVLPLDAESWRRPAATELVAYLGAFNPEDGSNSVYSDFKLSYVYLPPRGDFQHRYQIFRDVSIRPRQRGLGSRVLIALAQWRDEDNHHWLTTGPVVAHGALFDGVKGYLLTREEPGTVRVDECAEKDWEVSGRVTLVTARKGCSAGARLRTAGWLYRQGGSVTLTENRGSTLSLGSGNSPDAVGYLQN